MRVLPLQAARVLHRTPSRVIYTKYNRRNEPTLLSCVIILKLMLHRSSTNILPSILVMDLLDQIADRLNTIQLWCILIQRCLPLFSRTIICSWKSLHTVSEAGRWDVGFTLTVTKHSRYFCHSATFLQPELREGKWRRSFFSLPHLNIIRRQQGRDCAWDANKRNDCQLTVTTWNRAKNEWHPGSKPLLRCCGECCVFPRTRLSVATHTWETETKINCDKQKMKKCNEQSRD